MLKNERKETYLGEASERKHIMECFKRDQRMGNEKMDLDVSGVAHPSSFDITNILRNCQGFHQSRLSNNAILYP